MCTSSSTIKQSNFGKSTAYVCGKRLNAGREKNVDILLFLAMLKSMQIPTHVGRFSLGHVSLIAIYL